MVCSWVVKEWLGTIGIRELGGDSEVIKVYAGWLSEAKPFKCRPLTLYSSSATHQTQTQTLIFVDFYADLRALEGPQSRNRSRSASIAADLWLFWLEYRTRQSGTGYNWLVGDYLNLRSVVRSLLLSGRTRLDRVGPTKFSRSVRSGCALEGQARRSIAAIDRVQAVQNYCCALYEFGHRILVLSFVNSLRVPIIRIRK